MRDAERLCAPNLPFNRHSGAGYDSEQRRFPTAVSADQADTLTSIDLKIDVSEQWQMAIGQRHIIYTK